MTVVGRIVAAFGLTAITYVGFDVLIGQFKDKIQEWVSLIPEAMLQLFYMSGGGVVLNILFGMMTFIVTFKGMSKLTTVLGRK